MLITGAGSGIGKLLAVRAAQLGSRIVAWDLDGDAAERTADEIKSNGGQAEAFRVNVADREQVRSVAREVGQIDIVVNSAGIVNGKSLLELSEEDILRTFDVNVLGLYWVTRAFLLGMIERGHGTVVTVASAAGLVGVARQADYSPSKFAAVGFAESLRAEMKKGKTGVKSLVVCPYYIDTGMFAGVKTRFPLLLPIMSPEYVVGRIIKALERGSEQLIMPRFVRILPLARVLPVAAFDRLVSAFGVNSTMDGFTGRARDQSSQTS